MAYVEKCYNMKAERLGEDLMRELNTQVMLRVIDTRWMNYLQEMDYLKTGIGLRGFGQRDRWLSTRPRPTARSRYSSIPCMRITCARFCASRSRLPRVPWSTRKSPRSEGARFSGPPRSMVITATRCCASRRRCRPARLSKADRLPVNNGGKVTTYRKSESDDPYVNVGRNDPCPCGSGKKFKYCHGRNR